MFAALDGVSENNMKMRHAAGAEHVPDLLTDVDKCPVFRFFCTV